MVRTYTRTKTYAVDLGRSFETGRVFFGGRASYGTADSMVGTEYWVRFGAIQLSWLRVPE